MHGLMHNHDAQNIVKFNAYTQKCTYCIIITTIKTDGLVIWISCLPELHNWTKSYYNIIIILHYKNSINCCVDKSMVTTDALQLGSSSVHDSNVHERNYQVSCYL